VSLVQAALRGRRRQYAARAGLEALAELNATLEARVDAAIVARLQDQARLAKTESALRQAQRMEAVGQLTGGVAHDFNNLLMAFSSGMYLLDQPMDVERRRQVIEGMRQALERGSALTRQLLAFSRRRPLASKTVDLRALLLGMREMLQHSLRGDVKVEMLFEDHLWFVDVDPSELELAVLNICVNSRDAMPDGGTIAISVRNSPGALAPTHLEAVTLAISDTGVGMAPDVQAHVFEPFFTTKEVGKGSGLGLAQVYGFIGQSNGTVAIDSAPGKGTIVSLVFPRSDKPLVSADPAAADLSRVAAVGRRGSRPRGHVMLVEDDQAVAVLTTQMLQSLGLAVTHMKCGRDALESLAARGDIDVVLSDVMMPGMSGVDLARAIGVSCPNLPVILTTGYIEAARNAMTEGHEVLVKPYTLDALAISLQAHLSRRSALAL
jgi:signal transduction histidine kinase/CheY-like chemotaxis protein